MSTHIAGFLDHADRFSAVVAAGTDWSAASPCEGWSAADVLGHVVDTQRDFLVKQGADLGPRPEGAPAQVWTEHLDAVRRAVADETWVTKSYDGYFGPTTLDATLATFHGFDLVVHRWDLARAFGADITFTDAEMADVDASIAVFGDALHSDGICRPAVPAPDGASRQVRLLATLGRTA